MAGLAGAGWAKSSVDFERTGGLLVCTGFVAATVAVAVAVVG